MSDNETQVASYSQIRKSGLYSALGKTITPIVTFLITIYIVRKLSVEEYGTYHVLLGVMYYIGLLSSLGLPSIFQRFVPEFHAKKHLTKIKKLVLHGSLYRTALAALLVVVIILFSDLSGRLFNIDNWLGYFQIFALAILFFLETELIGLVLTSLFLHKYYVISNLTYILMRAALLYYLLNRGWALRGLLWGEVVMYGIFLAILVFFYLTRFVRKLRHESDKGPADLPVKRLAKYGALSYFNEMGVMVLDVSTDVFIISAFLGPVAVGIYAFANKLTGMISRILPHSLLQEVIRPSFFIKYVDSDSDNALQKMGNLLIKIIAFFAIPSTFAVIILGERIIVLLFDPKYIDSLKVLWIVVSFLTIRHFQAPFGLILQSLEKVHFLFYSKVFSIYNLIFDLIVVQHWGITGVALVTGSAILFQDIFLYFAIKREAGFSLSFRPLFTVALNSLPMTVVLYLLRNSIANVFALALVVALATLVYFFTCFLHKIFTAGEQGIINRIIGKPLFKF
jgi:O-antigen/teichoic acid export membrane protein